jgi:hypothetical protein
MNKFPVSRFFALLLILQNSISVFSQTDGLLPDTNRLVLVFAGDIMGHDSQISGAFDSMTGLYDYEPSFRYVSDYILHADVAVANLEVTLAGKPFQGYPRFSSPDALAAEAKKAGFDVMVTANNHALDRGEDGLIRTINLLDSLEFFRAGTYLDSLERASMHPLILEKNGIRIALLNYTYGTNGLNVPPPREINRIDTPVMKNELQKAKEALADFVIVCIHWGNEYERFENKEQVRLAEFLFDNGADAVIGSHPHVVQPIRFYSTGSDSIAMRPVVYSLGNFISNQRDQYRDGGIIAELHLSKSQGHTRLDSLNYLPCYVWRATKTAGGSAFCILPVARYERTPELFELMPADTVKLYRFATDTRIHLSGSRESVYYE